LILEKIQLTDLDDMAHIPSGRYITDMIAGNANWRSDETLIAGKISKAADIFSFGVVVYIR
jgi:hypothetical protein